MKYFFLIASLFISSSTLAVEYTFPDNGSWYQLQNNDFIEVCTSSDELYDVAEGSYTLIEFGVGDDDPVRTQVTVENKLEFLSPYKSCENVTRCSIEAGGIGTIITGVLCSAFDLETDMILPVQTTFTAGSGIEWGVCRTNTPARIDIMVYSVTADDVRF